MRKKSHISLAKYIVESMNEQDLLKHKRAFYLGSILPDCKPSFFTTRHEMQGTFLKVQQEIKRLAEGKDVQNMRAYFRDLGQVIHYVADYFTFPHNEHYTGNLKDHCKYEKELTKGLQEYIEHGETQKNYIQPTGLDTPEAICDFIRNAHDRYIKWKSNVEEDCRVIVALCRQVVEAVFQLFQKHQCRMMSEMI